jgi:hypothetical protein
MIENEGVMGFVVSQLFWSLAITQDDFITMMPAVASSLQKFIRSQYSNQYLSFNTDRFI